jgi:hypothetical protein
MLLLFHADAEAKVSLALDGLAQIHNKHTSPEFHRWAQSRFPVQVDTALSNENKFAHDAQALSNNDGQHRLTVYRNCCLSFLPQPSHKQHCHSSESL